MAVEYHKAPTPVIDLVARVLEKNHDDLTGARIGVIMREKAATSHGRRILGEAQKVSAKMQVFMQLDFLLTFAEDAWQELDAFQREALVDHELCHCTITEEEQVRMVPHDIEMFRANFDRYGFWWPHSTATKEAFQARLGLEAENAGKGQVRAIDPRQMDIITEAEKILGGEEGDEKAE